MLTQKVINNIYSFIKSITGTISCDNFIVILFIEKGFIANIKDNFNESLNKLLISIESIHQDIANSIVINFINENDVVLYRQKVLMQCLAKHFNLERYYSINEKIDTFYEYDNILEEFKNRSNTTVKALDFMAKVLSSSAFETAEEISEDSLDTIYNFFLTHLKKILSTKSKKI